MFQRHSVLVGSRVFSYLRSIKWYTKSFYVLLFKVNVYHRPNHPVVAEVLFVGCYVLQCFSFFKQRRQDGGEKKSCQNEHVKSILSFIA